MDENKLTFSLGILKHFINDSLGILKHFINDSLGLDYESIVKNINIDNSLVYITFFQNYLSG